MKRIMTLVITLCMIVSLMSVSAFAAESTSSSNIVINKGAITKMFDSNLYVSANSDAGLDENVKVSAELLQGTFNLYLPGSADPSQLRLSWDDSSVSLINKGTKYASGEAPVPAAGETMIYRVKKGLISLYIAVKTLKGSEGIDAMYLNIDESLGTIDDMNSDEDQEATCYGTVKTGDIDMCMSMKGRGNSTWKFTKKPYNMTLYKNNKYDDKKKAELVSGTKSKKWSLLANYLDNSLMRNKIAEDLADNMGVGLDTKFVDVWMNGEYLGNYLLTPKKDYYTPEDGYVIENDQYELENDPDQYEFPNIGLLPLKENYINIKDIGDNAKEAGVTNDSIMEYFTQAWNAVLDYDSEEYQNYFDIESFAKLYLMVEVSKTYDCYSGNLLMRREGLTDEDKLIGGPAWDYDVAFGCTLYHVHTGVDCWKQMNAESWYLDNIGYENYNGDEPVTFLQGLGKHASFRQKVVEVYNEYQWAFEAMTQDIDTQTELLRASAEMNNVKYGTNSLSTEYVIAPDVMKVLGSGDYALDYQVTTTWDSYVHNLREYCCKRVMWMTDNIGTFTA